MATRFACGLALLAMACRPFEEEARPTSADAGGDHSAPDGGVLRATILVDDPSSTTVSQLRGTATSLYWIAGGARVKRTDKLTGGVTTVLEAKTFGVHGGGIPSITSDATTLFAVAYGLGADPFCRNVMAVDGSTRDLGYGCGQARGLSTYERFVFFGNWSEVGDDHLHAIDTTAKSERKLLLGANEQVSTTCAAAGRVYFATDEGTSIRYVTTATFDAAVPFAKELGTVSSLACDADGIVWSTKTGKLLAQAHGATDGITLGTGLDDAHAIVLSGADVLFASGSFVRAVPRVGGAERLVWRAPDRIDSFVVDADAFFVAAAPRTIFRVDR